VAIPTQVFAYDANDRVTSYTWDNNGNLLNDGTNTYTWNGKNELVRVVSAGVDVSYSYDGDGLRISRIDNLTGIITYYVWDDQNPTGYPQVIEEVENNVVTKRYGYGHYLETIDILNGSVYERFYVIRDGTTSIRMLLDSAGNIAAMYDYDAFGNVITQFNTNPLTASNNFGYDSEYKDPTTGLIYLRARWYKVSEGRFLCKDTYEGNNSRAATLNKYIFVANNPINFKDSDGKMFTYMEASFASSIQSILSFQPLVTISETGLIAAMIGASSLIGTEYYHYTTKIRAEQIRNSGRLGMSNNLTFMPVMIQDSENGEKDYELSGAIFNVSRTYYSPNFYTSRFEAKSKLALPYMPEVRISLILYPIRDMLIPPIPLPVLPANKAPGGGFEFFTYKTININSRCAMFTDMMF